MKTTFGIMYLLIIVSVIVGVGIGWVKNIILLASINEVMTGEGVLRIAGIFIPPMGAVLGYIGNF